MSVKPRTSYGVVSQMNEPLKLTQLRFSVASQLRLPAPPQHG